MRLIIQIISIGIILISCNVNSEQYENKDVEQKTTIDPINSLNDTLEDVVHRTEYLEEYLNPIRQKVEALSTINEWTSIDKRKIITDSTRGSGEYYFLYGELKLIRQFQFNQTTRRITEFFIDNDTVFFVFDKFIDSVALKKDSKYFEPYTDSIFFNKNEIIRIIANEDCGVPFSESYRNHEQARLNNEYIKLRKALK